MVVFELRGDMIVQGGELRESTMDHVFVLVSLSPITLSLPFAFTRAENGVGQKMYL